MKITSISKLLPFVGGIVFIALLLVVMKSCGSDDAASGQLLEQIPDTPLPDADTPADTIKTLTAAVSALIVDIEALHKDNSSIRENQRDLKLQFDRLNRDVDSKIANKFAKQDIDIETGASLGAGDIQLIRDELAELKQQFESKATTDIPLGLGYDNIPINQSSENNYVWSHIDVAATDSTPGAARTGFQSRTATTKPMYTLPQNATLVGSKLMTAMIGRVPKQNEVVDAMPFKVITGIENLAANGLEIQGIKGMIWSGTAVGDWTLSCVSGRLKSVTFVFENGTIHTTSTAKTSNAEIGWLSDEFGLPCIPGERKTNLAGWIAATTLSHSVSAAANAAAVSETTRSINSFGQANSAITGDLGSFVLGKSVAGGAESFAAWLAKRVDQEFDAVLVPAGTLVAIHVEAEISIDLNSEGRKLNYADSTIESTSATLD